LLIERTRIVLWGLMMNVSEEYRKFCKEKGVAFQLDENVGSYDKTTLFCPAGMQQFKEKFKSEETGTLANIQSCIRLKDFDEIGDGTHFLHFKMIGLFSFRTMTLKQAIDFWMEFLEVKLLLSIEVVTIHPDKMEDWKGLYDEYDLLIIKPDEECIWTDGDIGGYCTEFYIQDIEIGNIVNPLGTCIDVGFGLERLQNILDTTEAKSREDILIETSEVILQSGFVPSNKEQGYVLRKLLRDLFKLGSTWDNPHYQKEKERQERLMHEYSRLKNKKKFKDKTKEWWLDTMGMDVDFIESLDK
jgi:alanyl-tRNA synthetase